VTEVATAIRGLLDTALTSHGISVTVGQSADTIEKEKRVFVHTSTTDNFDPAITNVLETEVQVVLRSHYESMTLANFDAAWRAVLNVLVDPDLGEDMNLDTDPFHVAVDSIDAEIDEDFWTRTATLKVVHVIDTSTA
tara:strand:+ start:42 stop:452 length:411 start_codon:yes stop_codon:yes gene_type:complete